MSKSSSTKSLTEFREFRLTASKRRPAAASENAEPTSTALPTKTPTTTSTPRKATTEAPSTPRAQSVASQAARQSICGAKPPGSARRVLPPVPRFDEASPAVAPIATPLKPTVIAPAAAAIAPIGSVSSLTSRAGGDADESFEFDDSDFAVDAFSVSSILNADAWKENDDEAGEEVAPLPDAHALAAAAGTPRRSTLAGSGSTPRAANRGSIYGGALRTPSRTKTVSLLRTQASRLTLSGALPSVRAATPSRSGAAASQSQQAPQSLGGLSSGAVRTPAKASRSVHAGFMSPTRASMMQAREHTPTRTYVAM